MQSPDSTGVAGRDPFVGDVTELVEANLLRMETGAEDGEPRYLMLETIRDYGIEQLEASDEDVIVRDTHAAWCLGIAEDAAPYWYTGSQGRWAARLDAEHDNLRAALAWLALRTIP